MGIFINTKRILLVLATVMLLQGCGIKFWYNRIDWVASWYIDDFVELTDAQENRFEKFVELKTEWHRATELPKYVSFIDAVKEDITEGTVAENYAARSETIRSFYQSILGEMEGEIVSVMTTFSDEQISSLLTTLEKNDKRRLEDVKELTQEEIIEERVDDIKDGVSDWIGRLTKTQKALIKEWAGQLQSTFSERMVYRGQWREAMLAALGERATKEGEEKLLELLRNPQTLQSDQLRSAQEHNRQLGETYVIKIYETLTKKQTRRLLNRLSDYQEDFQDLIDQGSDLD